MTTDADFKSKVRERMARTGENYTTARAALLAQAATLPDDDFMKRTIRTFLDGPTLTSIPTKRRARAFVLMHLLQRFEVGRVYAEREVNDILRTAHPDISTLRRELVDYRWLCREDGRYWVTEEVPDREGAEMQEVPRDEAERLARLPRSE